MKWFVRDEAYLVTLWLKAWMAKDGAPSIRTLATQIREGRTKNITDRLMCDCCQGLKRFSYQAIYAKLRRLSSDRLFLGRNLTYVEKQTVLARYRGNHATTELLSSAGTSGEGGGWQFKGLVHTRLSPAIEWIERRETNPALRKALLESVFIFPDTCTPVPSMTLGGLKGKAVACY